MIDRDNLLMSLDALIRKCAEHPEIYLSTLYTLDSILNQMQQEVARAILVASKRIGENNTNMAASKDDDGNVLGARLG